ncbi:hypothetical protein ABT56_14530 [Photobacterium aquae]|uniref:HTH tetR-type domain-containing protein n=1 Tax=Photobacterium aquae TaxID=1195763 RepID=A0A0J1GYD6_9GAMM|nr:TetR/AcrR family transcriptional regulator [Photobacterium aquae]KLV04668.1 hypothetical protein ABT56_14530 [Photobacterium aquae]
MAKVTAEESAKTRHRITQAVIHCLLDPHIGFEKMTYTRLQHMTGLSRGGILNHFHKKDHFLTTLDLGQEIFASLIAPLDLTSSERLAASFGRAIQQPRFKAIIQLLISNNSQHYAKQQAQLGWHQLEHHIESQLGKQTKEDVLPRLLGKGINQFIFQQ